jgi:hypothetical protein
MIDRLRNMKRKVKKFHAWRRFSEDKIKELQRDNSSKNLLLASLYNVIKGLLNKLTVAERKNIVKKISFVVTNRLKNYFYSKKMPYRSLIIQNYVTQI